jgi:pyrimidine deaminase RibD-like protein
MSHGAIVGGKVSSSKSGVLARLRDQLVALPPLPWEGIEAWAAGALPFFRSSMPVHLEDFQATTKSPGWVSLPVFGGGGGVFGEPAWDSSEEVSATEAEVNRKIAERSYQKILSWLDGVIASTPDEEPSTPASAAPSVLPEDAQRYAELQLLILNREARERIEAERVAARKAAGPLRSPLATLHEFAADQAKLCEALARARLETLVSSLRRFGMAVRPYHDLIMKEVSDGVRAGTEGTRAEIERLAIAGGSPPNMYGLIADADRVAGHVLSEANVRLKLAEFDDGDAHKARPAQGPYGDDAFMRLAISEAARCVAEDGGARPMVGVVVVRDGRILCSSRRGELSPGDHAEYTALEGKLKSSSLVGSTVYTTLEPCTSRSAPKKPCVKRLIERKISRVVIGMVDPNPKITGKGILRLREANIAVELFPSDLMSEIEEMNRSFSGCFSNGKEAFSSPERMESVAQGVTQSVLAALPTGSAPTPRLAEVERRGLESVRREITRVENDMAEMRKRNMWDTPTTLTRLEGLRSIASNAAPLLALHTGISVQEVREWIGAVDFPDGPNDAFVALRSAISRLLDEREDIGK